MTPNFQPPTDEQVKAILRRIPTLQLRRAFFEGLKNPLWVTPLEKEGMFDNPPEPEDTGDGLIRDVYWPEIDYLVRMASHVPNAVVDVLLNLRASNNAWVRRGVFSIGAAIPPDQAVRLEPLIKSWKATGFGWRTDPRDLVMLAVNLVKGGQTDVGIWFAGLIFRPSQREGRHRPAAVIDDYWFERGLLELVAAIGQDGLAVVLPWLFAYERASGKLDDKSDLTYLTRESIRIRDDIGEGLEQALIEAVRDLAIEAMLVDAPAAKEMLLSRSTLIGRKISLFSLGEAIRQIGSTDQRAQSLLSVASELLFAEQSSHHSCRIDYAELAQAVARLSPETLDPLFEFIERGSRAAGDRIRARRTWDEEEAADVDNQIDEYCDHWKHSWLSAIGLEALPAGLQATLADLDSKFGVIDAPLAPTPIVTSWVGLHSPVTQDEMAAMSPLELVAHLESWHDSGDGWGPEPSHNGQGRELTALLTLNPRAVAGVTDLVGRLRPTYLRAILSGWEAAAKSNEAPDWTQVVEVITGVLDHGSQSSFPSEGGRGDDDVDFRYAKQAAVALLQLLAKPNVTLAIPEGLLSRFAELTISSASDEEAWDEYIAEADTGGMDALTTSLNWQWPIRIRGLIYLMAHGKATGWYHSARSALETELSRVDTPGASRAVLGASVGRLLSVDAEWLVSRVPKLFGSDVDLSTDQQIALTTAISSHHYHLQIYDLLSAPMIGAIRSDQPIVAGWHTQIDPLRRIGEWIITAIAYGDKPFDDALAQEFFSAASPKIRGDALGHIAWAFMHANAVDDLIRDRVAELWDSRVKYVQSSPADHEELSGFYWFVKSHRFAAEWWLPRLKEAIALCPELTSECHIIAEEVALSADVDPRAALDVLKQVLGGRDETGIVSFELTQTAVPIVIARAIDSGNDVLKQDALTYMNELGEKGNLTLETEVGRFLGQGQR